MEKKFYQSKKDKAVALKYDKNKDSAPRVVAKGEGTLAKKMVELAQVHGISLYESEESVDLFFELPLNFEIPEELYQLTAIILSEVYRLEEKSEKSSKSKQKKNWV